MEKLRIDLFADIACPWCYIGERRLAKALEERPDLEIEWRWHPFQLQPAMPMEGLPWTEFVEKKFGGMARAQQLFAHVVSVGAVEGIEFRFDHIANAPNTRDAHRLVLYARERGQEAVLALFRANFTEGKSLSEIETLVEIGASIGFDADELRAYLASEQGADEVMKSQEEAEHLGVTGVPFYIFDRRIAFSGAQPVEVFLRAIDRGVSNVEG